MLSQWHITCTTVFCYMSSRKNSFFYWLSVSPVISCSWFFVLFLSFRVKKVFIIYLVTVVDGNRTIRDSMLEISYKKKRCKMGSQASCFGGFNLDFFAWKNFWKIELEISCLRNLLFGCTEKSDISKTITFSWLLLLAE